MFRPAVVVLCLGLFFQTSTAAEEEHAPSRQKRSAEENNACADDYVTAGICAACADLPTGMALPLEECCLKEGIQAVCSACLIDVEECTREMINIKLKELEALKNGNYENDDLEDLEGQAMSKRFGRMFMGGGKTYGYSKGDVDKRYGKLFMSARSYQRKPDPYLSEHKRYGKLFMGGRGRSSYGTSGLDSYLGEAKRYGKLFMGKRFGQLFLGKSYGKSREEKRQLGDDTEDSLVYSPSEKRFGRLFLSGRHRYGSSTSNKNDSH